MSASPGVLVNHGVSQNGRPTTCVECPIYSRQRRRVGVEQRAVDREKALVGVARRKDGTEPRLLGLQLRRAFGDLLLKPFIDDAKRVLGALAFRDILKVDRDALVTCSVDANIEPAVGFAPVMSRKRRRPARPLRDGNAGPWDFRRLRETPARNSCQSGSAPSGAACARPRH